MPTRRHKTLVVCGTLCTFITLLPDKCFGLTLWKRAVGIEEATITANRLRPIHEITSSAGAGPTSFRFPAIVNNPSPYIRANDPLISRTSTTLPKKLPAIGKKPSNAFQSPSQALKPEDPVNPDYFRKNLQFRGQFSQVEMSHIETYLQSTDKEFYEQFLKGERNSNDIIAKLKLQHSPVKIDDLVPASLFLQTINRPVDYLKIMHPEMSETQLLEVTRGIMLFRIDNPQVYMLTKKTVEQIFEEWRKSPRLRPLHTPHIPIPAPKMIQDLVSPRFFRINWRYRTGWSDFEFNKFENWLEITHNEFFLRYQLGRKSLADVVSILRDSPFPEPPNLNVLSIISDTVRRPFDYLDIAHPEIGYSQMGQLARRATIYNQQHTISFFTRTILEKIYEEWNKSPRFLPLDIPLQPMSQPEQAWDLISPDYFRKIFVYRTRQTNDRVDSFESWLEIQHNIFFLKYKRGQATVEELFQKLENSPYRERSFDKSKITGDSISSPLAYLQTMHPDLTPREMKKLKPRIDSLTPPRDPTSPRRIYSKAQVEEIFENFRKPSELFAILSKARKTWNKLFNKSLQTILKIFQSLV